MTTEEQIEQLKQMVQVLAFDHAETKRVLDQVTKTFLLLEKTHTKMYKILMSHDKILRAESYDEEKVWWLGEWLVWWHTATLFHSTVCNPDDFNHLSLRVEPMKQIIHVNQHIIKKNTKHGTDEPVLTVKTYKENNYAHEAILKTKEGVELARVIYSPHKPLSCGARVWLEMDTETTDVELIIRERGNDE